MDPLIIVLTCISAGAIAVTLAVVIATAFTFIVDNPEHWFSRPWVICWDAMRVCVQTAFGPVFRAVRR